jgi:hypothetical protein
MNPNPYIDYSQYYAWHKCPAFWYEQSVAKRCSRPPEGQRDDALAIGSLVHAGLQNWQLLHTVEIPQDVVDEIGPTKEALDSCNSMINGYAQTYPFEPWELVRCEEPVRFPLQRTCNDPTCGGNQGDYNLDGLAKIDMYFYAEAQTTLESGVPGQTLTLSPGWWIQEYKTKDPQIDLALWMRKWESNMQASFQTLALQAKVEYPVQGVLVTIIEKPKTYEPKRKCKQCVTQYAFDLWLPTGEGTYACPVCGNIQKVAKLKSDPIESAPRYYRQIVTRSPQRLERDQSQILQVAQSMQEMRTGGLRSWPWQTEACVDPRMKRTCPYFNNHIPDHGLPTSEDPMMIQIADYVKEV